MRKDSHRNPGSPDNLINPGSDILSMKKTFNDDLTHKIIGCAMKVHSTMGNGFQEVIYQRCLAIEMAEWGLNFIREQEMPLYYKEIQVGTGRVDILVEEKILVELKALTHLEELHLAQALNYLEAFKLKTGLLINFGAKSLQFKRLINKKIK